jgi:transcriptional regulator with XRE-family HTH domain
VEEDVVLDKHELGLRIRRARKDRGLTLSDMKTLGGVSATHMSEIERGLTSPSIQILVKIAKVLDRPVKFFLEKNWLDSVARTSLENRPAPAHVGDGSRAQPLSSGIAGHHLGMALLRLDPGTNCEVEQGPHEGDEALLVLSGSVKVVLGDREISLDTGDSLHFSANRPHTIRNASSVAVAEIAWAADSRHEMPVRATPQRASAA